MQESLLSLVEETRLRALNDKVERRTLTRGAWIDLCPGWLTGTTARQQPHLGTISARARGSDRDGRLLPAHLGACDQQDGPAGRPPNQHPVPPPRGAIVPAATVAGRHENPGR